MGSGTAPMPSSFPRTLRSVQRDGFRASMLALGIGAGLLAVWFWWAMTARVPVFVLSEHARLVSPADVHVVETPIEGRVERIAVALGDQVRAGAVLVELETDAARLRLEERRAQRVALANQLAPLARQVELEAQAVARAAENSRAAEDEAKALAKEARVSAEYADDERRNLGALAHDGHIATAELQEANAEAARHGARAEALRQSIGRVRASRALSQLDRSAALQALRRDLATLQGALEAMNVTIAQLERDIELAKIRAPIDGRVGELAELSVGAVVSQGERMLSVVPAGTPKVVAEFVASEAVGRIHAGQSAELRLDAFPWAQYGVVRAVVERTASEPQRARVAVQLRVVGRSNLALPVEHGLSGRVEVRVEEASPIALILRAAGRMVAPNSEAGAAPAP